MEDTQLKCVIVDDEPMALNLVETYVEKTPFLKLLNKYSSAVDAMEFLKTENVDVLFLDIQMPDLSGLEFSKLIPKNTRIIFTTAFDQYALEGYKVEALDYLLKPFNYGEFLAAAYKAKEWFTLVNSKNISENSNSVKEKIEFLFVKSEYKQLRIKLSNVLYFEGLKDYIKIYLAGEPKPILTLMSLKSLQEKLPEGDFLRVHRSFIISLKHVEIVERSQIIINNQRITVSEQYKPKFLNFLKNNSLNT